MKSEWTKKKLSDIADFNPRETVKKGAIAKKIPMDVLRPFYRDIPYYVEECFSGGTKFRNGDTIMARITPCLENGKTAQVSILNDGEVGFGSTEYIVFRAKKGIADKDYLYYLVCSPEVREPAIKSMVGSSGRQRVQTEVVKNLEIDVPPLVEQEKIGSFLKAFDDKIALNDRINKNLLEQALAIYKDWFCDYALSDGTLPEDWKITTIDAISSLVTRGIAPKYDDSSEQIVLNQKCIRDHTIDISLARRHLPKKINEKWISKGDLLINSTGTGTLGRVAQVWFEANNMTVDSHVTIVRPKDPILQSYIGFWGLSHESEIEAQHTGSTGQTELPRDRVKAIELPLPDEDTLSKFNELVIPMTSTVISNQEENARLSQLRDALLPKLMSGELDVSDIDL
ncbi:restriction endonuclease subunit S [Filifactor villosus]|uniref:Restriction endonuclease subunit S n=1 Tax=Filifactor villosus TaxID=29374 RepID=A0ABV9QL56_9FIRM